MTQSPFTMRFDPRTIEHLGVRMYSTLPPALAELISNAYDADAENVDIVLHEQGGRPSTINVKDDGVGLSFDDINDKFLVIGRNRRAEDGDLPSPRHKRLPTGKKGLGKLALFGLARTIQIESCKDGVANAFVLDWEDLQAAESDYHPTATRINEETSESDGTTITLSNLKRASRFDPTSLADSLSRIFIVDESFKLTITTPLGERIHVDSTRKYSTIDQEFVWDLDAEELLPEGSDYANLLTGQLITSDKPIPPSSGLRGVTLYSRGKLVNAPEFFSSSASSHFYQYLTGWITVDFIDQLSEDVISTNRQSIDWDHREMAPLRKALADIVSTVKNDWRAKRKAKKQEKLKQATSIDTEAWVNTFPAENRKGMEAVINALSTEDAFDSFTPVIKHLHDLMPEYPLLHWRHLHEALRERVEAHYKAEQYGHAAAEGVKIYCEELRNITGLQTDGRELVDPIFGKKPFETPPNIQICADLTTKTGVNLQEGQAHLSRGVVTGFRNPIEHQPMDTAVPALFSELDCLNVLSLVSYLFERLDGATVNS